jgi:hypothetical protein
MDMRVSPLRTATCHPPRCPSCTGALCSIDVGGADETLACWICDCGYEGEIRRQAPCGALRSTGAGERPRAAGGMMQHGAVRPTPQS